MKRETGKRPHDSGKEKKVFAHVQTSVEIMSPATAGGKYGEKEYLRRFIREPEVKAREGKMTYIRPEYHERIMRIIRVIGDDGMTLSGYIDHVLTHHFKQCEEAMRSLYTRNYNPVF
jgi:hypothetical protein